MFSILDYVKENYIKIILLVVFIVAGIFYYFKFNENIDLEQKQLIVETNKEEIVEKVDENKKVYIDIKGQIKKPGFYEMEAGKRIHDVILQAGGLTSKADTSVINLARTVYDEMVIVIYSKDEVKKFKDVKTEEEIKEAECKVVNYNIINEACTSSNDKNTGNINSATSNSTADKKSETSGNGDNANNTSSKISLNSATKEQLMTLSGIGEAKADLILSYREKNGGFKDITELMNISGIGNATFEKLKDLITI